MATTVEGAAAGSESAERKAGAPTRPTFRPTKRKPIARVLALFVVLAIAGALVARRMQPKAVTTAPVLRGVAVEAVYATGTVEAFDRVVVKAKVSGSIAELKVREGDKVKKGDLLAIVDSPTLKFELAKGKADLWAASSQAGKTSPQLEALASQAQATEAQLKTAREERDRLTTLVATGTATQVELDKAKTNVAALEAQLAGQIAQRRSLQIELGAKASGAGAAVDSIAARLADLEVRSPLDGVVLARTVEPGEVVMVNQPLFRVGNVENLVLEVSIDEADVGKVELGKKAAVSLYAFPAQAFHGEVFEILPDADRAKKTFLAKVRVLDAPKGLRSGMTAEVNVIVAERPGSLLAPAEAIDANGNAWVVRDGRAEQRKLTIGVRDMLRVEILGGVVEGDALIIGGADALSPGTKVLATEKAPLLSAPPPPRPKAGI